MKNEILTSVYIADAKSGIWSRPGYTGIAYSDGNEVEDRIAEAIDQASDITVLSAELRQHCIDWPSLYHLSGTRANILRPFDASLRGNILEIGSGCGAITRYLGESGANVLALEGSPRRAAITRSRTRDLENVTVLAEKLDQFQSDCRFDVITLIGVLEYANLFTASKNAAFAMLQHVRSLLKPQGRLIIAIENQLGLKYFAGAPEDHLGQPMYGIEGRYAANQPQTFGRAVLAGLLEKAGFAVAEFLAPFPDYKLPVSILTIEGLSSKRFDSAALAWQSVRHDPQLPLSTNFSLELTWPEIFKNGLALEMANSFLIAASPLRQQTIKAGILGYHYSTDRAPQYCKEIVFTHADDNTVEVNYHMLSHAHYSGGIDPIIQFRCPEKMVYTEGIPLSLELVKIITRDGWSIEEVGTYIQRYINFLYLIAEQQNSSLKLAKSTDKLPGNFFDMIPQNIIVKRREHPIPIDAEWSVDGEIELGWLLFRSLLPIIGSAVSFGRNSTSQTLSRHDFIRSALDAAGFPLEDRDFRRFVELESVVHRQVTGRTAQESLNLWLEQPLPTYSVVSYDGRIVGRDGHIASLDQALKERDRQIANLDQVLVERNNQISNLKQAQLALNVRITAIESSTFWKMTLPLRKALVGQPKLRKLGRRTAKLVWRLGKPRLGQKLHKWKEWNRSHTDIPHFAPPTDDYSLIIPLGYAVEKWETSPNVAVICHMYYADMVDEFQGYLINIPFPFDIFITTDSLEKKLKIENCFSLWNRGKVEIRVAPNRGRDIAPKLITCGDVYDRYEFVLHIHTKKSLHAEVLGGWRFYLLETLLGSEKIVESVFESFRRDSKLGMVAPQHFLTVRSYVGWGWNFETAKKFANRLGIKISLNGRLDFPSGSMFWARSAALKPLLDCNLSVEEFPIESEQNDGTLGHVIERLYFFVCERAGYRWIKVCRPSLLEQAERIKYVENQEELINFIKITQYRLLESRVFQLFRPLLTKSKDESIGRERELDHLVYEKSDFRTMEFSQFQQELALHIEKKQSLIDFDENFYLGVNGDVAASVTNGDFSCGFVHYCLVGQNEGRIWSNYQLERKFSLSPNFPGGFNAPVYIRPLPKPNIDLGCLPRSPEPFLLIFFSHLQDDLFFAGYTEFFHDFNPIFGKFSKIVLSIENENYNPRLATRYSDRIEVVQKRELRELRYQPDLVVAFNSRLFMNAEQICNDRNRIIYYCQDFEAGFFPYGDEYVEAEKAIARSRNIIVSTHLLRSFLVEKRLLSHQQVFTTSPQIETFDVPAEKTNRIFFYFRPEPFHQRNLPHTLMEVVRDFCEKHSGYEVYMVGSVDTRYSFKINGTTVYIISKLPKGDYIQLISSSDAVISMIYSAHPGVLAFQAAASGIPTVTNIFENRDARLLRQISENIVPYDPIRNDLLELIEEALGMEKGRKSFNESLYSAPQPQSLSNFIDTILSSE